MLRWLVFIQACVYLLIMPTLRASVELGYNPPITLALIAVVALALGSFFPPLNRTTLNPVSDDIVRLRPRSSLWLGWILLAFVYSIVAVRYDLLNRRQGSEFMAELYATLPLPVLAILRGYELLFIPTLILYTFGTDKEEKWHRIAILVASLLSLPFMGLADSRGRLLVMGIYLVSFVPSDRFIVYFFRNWRIIAGGLLGVSAFAAASVKRAADYGSLSDYLFMEVYSRLDGLNLVAKLQEASLMSNWGKFDFAMFDPLIAKIPFLEAAQTAKLMGRTSTKQYLIQDILRSSNLDDTNSMITDPVYFAGVAGLVIAFFGLGWGLRRFDKFIAEKRLLVAFWPTTIAFSFAISFSVFENDYIGSLANMLQVMVLIAIFLAFCANRRSSAFRLSTA